MHYMCSAASPECSSALMEGCFFFFSLFFSEKGMQQQESDDLGSNHLPCNVADEAAANVASDGLEKADSSDQQVCQYFSDHYRSVMLADFRLC